MSVRRDQLLGRLSIIRSDLNIAQEAVARRIAELESDEPYEEYSTVALDRVKRLAHHSDGLYDLTEGW